MSLTYNPITGQFNNSSSGSTVVESTKRLQVVKTANEDLVIGDSVKMDDANSCSKSGVDTRENASVVGLCVSDALSGEDVTILLLGLIDNPVFLSIPFGVSVFQNNSGGVTINATTIVGEFWTRIGKSYGNGVILVGPEEPVEVT